MVENPQGSVHDFREWTASDARDWIAVPTHADDKYSRGVLGVITGSEQYPGAAVIGVDAALHTGVGMVRYRGEAPREVLTHRPEAVTAAGHVGAWLLGSGMTAPSERIRVAITEGRPTVLDAGALELAAGSSGPTVITPHAGELARMLGADRTDIEADRAGSVLRAVERFGVTVLLKGHESLIADPAGARWSVSASSAWLATAGTGDSLAGILGALVATHARDIEHDRSAMAALAATASRLHVTAAHIAQGPFTVLDLGRAIPAAVQHCLESGD